MPGHPLDHPLGDLERRQARVAGAAQDAEHVVLLPGHAGWRDDEGELVAHVVCRPHQAEQRLVPERAEGLVLAEFLLQQRRLAVPRQHYQSIVD